MKIYQIISEDYDNIGLFKQSNTPASTEPAKSDNTTTQDGEDSTVQQTINTVKSYMPDIGVDLSTVAIAGVSAIVIAKMTSSALSSVTSKFAAKARLSQRVEKMWKARYGPWAKVFGAIGVGTALTQLYENLYILEAMYVQGKLPGDDGGYAKFIEQREFEFGIFTTQVLMPTLLKWITRAIATLSGVKWAVRILGGLSVTATLGASVAATLASEAFIRWFQWWLGSEDGRNVLYKYFGGIVKTIGKPTENLWSTVLDSYNKADVKKYGDQASADAAKKTRDEKKAASGADKGILGTSSKTGYVTDPKNPETKIAVTDAQGNLLNNAALMANPQLNSLRYQAKIAGQPDPLAQFAKPGQRLPAIP